MTLQLNGVENNTNVLVDSLDCSFINGAAALASDNVFEGKITLNQPLCNNAEKIVIKGETGYLDVVQSQIGSAIKEVIVYLNDYTGDVTYEFPVSFTYVPDVFLTNDFASSLNLTVSEKEITLNGHNSTGYLFIKGF